MHWISNFPDTSYSVSSQNRIFGCICFLFKLQMQMQSIKSYELKDTEIKIYVYFFFHDWPISLHFMDNLLLFAFSACYFQAFFRSQYYFRYLQNIRGGHRVSARGGRDFLRTKLFQEIGTNLKKKVTTLKEKVQTSHSS